MRKVYMLLGLVFLSSSAYCQMTFDAAYQECCSQPQYAQACASGGVVIVTDNNGTPTDPTDDVTYFTVDPDVPNSDNLFHCISCRSVETPQGRFFVNGLGLNGGSNFGFHTGIGADCGIPVHVPKNIPSSQANEDFVQTRSSLTYPNATFASMELINIQGSIVLSESNTGSLSISAQKAGIYILRTTNELGIINTTKLIIQ